MKVETTAPVVSKADEAPATTRYTYTPRVVVREDEHAYYVEAEMPGVTEKSVDVKLEDGILTLLGRVEPRDYSGYQKVYSEYEVGHYERAFRISDAIDAAGIQASLANGLLRLTLPKREAVKPRRIDVRVA